MKIVFTGGGTGGHFYPIIAVAEQVHKELSKQKILGAKLYYFSTSPYDKNALFDNEMDFVYIPAGKLRTYFSIQNFFDLFKTFFGCIVALVQLFRVYPDVVFGKGGYASFPTLVAAIILRIPIVLHESDAAPGRVNALISKYAQKIALSYSDAVDYFKNKEILAHTGQPIREGIINSEREGAYEYLGLNPNLKTIVVIGGSQGSEIINNAVVDALPTLLEKYQVLHQTGSNNFKEVADRTAVLLENNPHKDRYHPMPFFNLITMRYVGGIGNVIITRAGSTLFEIALWGVPAIVIPFTVSNNDHAKKNAFAYARAGAGIVIEENNLTASILSSQISKILDNPEHAEQMSVQARSFGKKDAALKIAEVLVAIALSHETE